MTAYRLAERRALQALAMAVLADSKATDEERAAASERLLADTREPDFGRLSMAELLAFREACATGERLLAKARGEVLDEREPQRASVPAPIAAPAPVPDLAAQDEATIRAAMATEPEPIAPRPYTLHELLGR